MGFLANLDDRVSRSFIGKHFQLEGSGARRERTGTRFSTEIRAGLTTFFAMVSNKHQGMKLSSLIN
jgi:AGZA family xanthine/uracil permease-like MFS transporter